LWLAGRVLEFDPDVRGGRGYAIARDILDSGRALAKMNDIIRAQGAHPSDFTPGMHCFEVKARRTGTVTAIDNLHMAKIARIAGAPIDKKAGVDLIRKTGDAVSKDEVIYRIHAEFMSDFEFAKKLVAQKDGYTIGKEEDASEQYGFL
jgi:thymidine phosphorylase